METIHTIVWMQQVARDARAKERVLGLVPTMGALHEGHLSLVREALRRCSPVVVSLFVNPKQFGPSEDFRSIRARSKPTAPRSKSWASTICSRRPPEEMYPKDFRTAVIVEGLGDRLEGRSRPGHFRGVTTVVLKLFEIVQPRFAFFGRKDAQQVRIIRQMAADLNLDTEVVICPIVREPDGLALSSRNAYLKDGERQSATALYRSLDAARRAIQSGERDPVRILAALRHVIDAEPRVALDYAEIVDAETLEPAMTLQAALLYVDCRSRRRHAPDR